MSVNQRVLQRQLQNHGITVYVANHGGEALDRLQESQYWKGNAPDSIDLGVVLVGQARYLSKYIANLAQMDKEMPVMDGLQCTKCIREWEQTGLLTGHVPIIAVTANARSEQIAALIEVGMVS